MHACELACHCMHAVAFGVVPVVQLSRALAAEGSVRELRGSQCSDHFPHKRQQQREDMRPLVLLLLVLLGAAALSAVEASSTARTTKAKATATRATTTRTTTTTTTQAPTTRKTTARKTTARKTTSLRTTPGPDVVLSPAPTADVLASLPAGGACITLKNANKGFYFASAKKGAFSLTTCAKGGSCKCSSVTAACDPASGNCFKVRGR